MRRRDIHAKNPRRFGNSKEGGLAKSGGYRKTPNSGASGTKGDFRRGDFMVEMKATRRSSYAVSEEVMAKLRNDGLTNGKVGALVIELGNGTRYAVLPIDVFERMVPDDGD